MDVEDLGSQIFSDDFIQDPYPLYERMLDAGSVHRVGRTGFHCVCSWRGISEVLARPDDFSSNLTATMTYTPETGVSTYAMDEIGGPTQVLATADDPLHAVHRKILLPQLAAKRIRSAAEFVGETTNRLWLDGLDGSRIEWMGALANRLPMTIVARIIGVPDRDVDMLVHAGYATTQLLDGVIDAHGLQQAQHAAVELHTYINEHFARAAHDPGDNLLGDLVTACAGGTVDDTTAAVMMLTLFSAGGESTASLLGSAVWLLASRPDIQQSLRADRNLLGAFIEEALRYEPPFRGHYRHVLVDTILDDVELRAGDRLLLLWGAANRDPEQFESPSEFRLDRPKGKGHMTFGKGVHFCVGAGLARLEAQVVLAYLLDHTTWIETAAAERWLPSILVRRLSSLHLNVI
ncbi:cytochrome P450 [Mycobacterium sp. MBM]|nr:cytochrome P450 [Mycobacterium sp. MBM]